ncbi:MAG: outer membrane protein assembly factor BamD [Chthoniobacterales bacterium]
MISLLTLRNAMTNRLGILFSIAVGAVLFAPNSRAGIVFKPGEKAHYEAPGEEQISGTAQQLFDKGQEAEKSGDNAHAIKAYTAIFRHYPKDALAAGAAYRAAQLEEQSNDFQKAALSYRTIVERYPKFEHFDDAIEGQFRIGEMYLNGKKNRVMGVPFGDSLDHAVEIFAAIVRTAPYGKYTARAQFDIGLAREKQGNNDAAIQAYEAVVDKFPSDPVAADAQYQIGYIWFRAAKAGTKDAAAAKNAKTGFEDFLFRHPNSEKAAQARDDLKQLDQKQTNNAFQVAKFYDKQKNYRAAVIYYNEVIRQQPGSSEGNHAKRRVDELRAKFGDAALQPAIAAGGTSKKSKHGGGETAEGHGHSQEQMPSLPPDAAPLPPADADVSLPPPASLMPDTTTAPPPESTSAPAHSADSEATPAPSASPNQ